MHASITSASRIALDTMAATSSSRRKGANATAPIGRSTSADSFSIVLRLLSFSIAIIKFFVSGLEVQILASFLATANK